MMRYIIISGLFLWMFTGAMAQQQPVWSQYMLNQYAVNPATAGSTDDITVAASFKKLFAGVQKSPFNQYLTAQGKITEHMGVGVSIFNRTTSTTRRTGFTGTYAYHIHLNENGQKLAFGLSGGISQYIIDLKNLDAFDQDDPLLQSDVNILVPEVDFGTYYYSDIDNYYIGFSVRQLVQRRIYENSDRAALVRHFYLNAGYKFEINNDWSIEPTAMLSLSHINKPMADISILARYREMVWGGLLIRPVNAIAIMLGCDLQQFSLGYSYDIGLTALGKESFGSHEILLIYRFNNFIMK